MGALKTIGRAFFGGRAQVGTQVAKHDFLGSLRGLSEFNPVGKIMGKSGIKTLGGALLKQTLPYYAIGSGIDYVLDETRMGEEASPAARFGAQVLSFGFKANAVRHLARGATGTALYGAGAATGNPLRFQGAYKWVEGKLDHLAAAAVKLPGKAAWGAAKGVAKMAVGWPYAAVSAARVGTNFVGGALFGRYGALSAVARGVGFTGPGALMGKMGMKSAGEAWSRTGTRLHTGAARFFESRPAAAAQLTPSIGGFLRQRPFSWIPGAKKLGGSNFMQRAAPTMYGFATLGAGAAVAQSYARHKNESKSWVGGGMSPNPSNFGGGISAMRRGPASNYGPALTLMLHQNHSRRMP